MREWLFQFRAQTLWLIQQQRSLSGMSEPPESFWTQLNEWTASKLSSQASNMNTSTPPLPPLKRVTLQYCAKWPRPSTFSSPARQTAGPNDFLISYEENLDQTFICSSLKQMISPACSYVTELQDLQSGRRVQSVKNPLPRMLSAVYGNERNWTYTGIRVKREKLHPFCPISKTSSFVLFMFL